MQNSTLNKLAFATLIAASIVGSTKAATPVSNPIQAAQSQSIKNATTGAFKGIEVNGGTVNFTVEGGKNVLRLSNDFKLPKTPAPHWQIVDNAGNTFLLKQLKIAGNKTNKSVILPSYIKSVAKVQIWCSFAEVVLGEAGFPTAIDLS